VERSDVADSISSFGELLKKHRSRAGISQEELAERARLSVKTVAALEQGVRHKPYRHTIDRLSDALGLSAHQRLELERAAGAPDEAASRPNNLPSQLSSFVGREHETATVRNLIFKHRLVTLIGSGGVGKTRLALQVGAHFSDAAPDGVWFVDFAALANPQLVPHTIAAAMGVQITRNRLALESLVTQLKSKALLLILDNCEHLIDEVAHASNAILQHAPGVRILATSREALRITGEQSYRVPSLDVPPEGARAMAAVDALQYSAVALFIERAAATDNRFAMTDELTPTVVDICRRLDGIALAIELAAARVNVFSPKKLQQSLRERFLVLTGGNRAALPRHRTMSALIDWSYDLLTEKEQTFLRMLSIFADRFTDDLLFAFFAHDDAIKRDGVIELLTSLVDKSLVLVEGVSDEVPRYRLLDATRQHLLEKLVQRGEYNEVARRSALSLLACSSPLDTVLQVLPDQTWRKLPAIGIGNWRAGMEWALGSSGDVRIAQELAASRGVMWYLQSPGEDSYWLGKALEACNSQTPPALRAKLELAVARSAVAMGEVQNPAALEAARRALELAQKAGGELDACEARAYLGLFLLFARRVHEGRAHLEEALAAARACDARYLIGFAMHGLGIASFMERDWESTRRWFGAALELYKRAGSERHAAQIALSLAETEYMSGNLEIAAQLASEAVETLRVSGSPVTLTLALSYWSTYLGATGRPDEAWDAAHEALLLARDAGMPVRIAHALQHLAAAAAMRKSNLEAAASILGFVEARLRELEPERQEIDQAEYDRVLQLLREQLGTDMRELMEAGAHWSEDEAISEALKI
jgi:predicted ATPase/DNA-binding XRE family transcriptional regulator